MGIKASYIILNGVYVVVCEDGSAHKLTESEFNEFFASANYQLV